MRLVRLTLAAPDDQWTRTISSATEEAIVSVVYQLELVPVVLIRVERRPV